MRIKGKAAKMRQSANISDRFSVEVTRHIAKISDDWKKLQEFGTLFQSPYWISPWIDHIAPKLGITPIFVVVREKADKRPVILCLMGTRERYSVKITEFINGETVDYATPLIDPNYSFSKEEIAEIWKLICDSLPTFDVFYLENLLPTLADGSPNPFTELDWINQQQNSGWVVPLGTSRQEYNARLRRKDRKEHQRKRRNLTDRVGEIQIVEPQNRDEANALFENLVAQRRERFASRKYYDVFDDDAYYCFYRDVIISDFGKGARIFGVRGGSETIGALFGLPHKDGFYLLIFSFAGYLEAEKLSPGIVGIDVFIDHLLSNDLHVLDLAIGDQPYKHEFNPVQRVLYGGCFTPTTKGKIFIGARVRIRRLRNHKVVRRLLYTKRQLLFHR
jgi:CelD/BcsL family acetyltransferase involved in cellulose biosynthesis